MLLLSVDDAESGTLESKDVTELANEPDEDDEAAKESELAESER